MTITCILTDNQNSVVAGSSFTFLGMSLGAASADRYMLALISMTGGPANVSSITIDGVTATSVVSAQATTVRSAIFIAAVPTDATGDVVVTFNASVASCGVALLAVTGLQSSSAFDTATDTNTPLSQSLSVPDLGLAVGMVTGTTVTSLTFTWNPITEQFESSPSGTIEYSGAFSQYAASQTISVTATISGTALLASMVLASFSGILPTAPAAWLTA